MAGVIPSCRSVDADACCEYTFRALFIPSVSVNAATTL